MRAFAIQLFLLITPLFAQANEKSWSIRVAAMDIAEGHHILWLRTGVGKEPIKIPLNTRIFSQPIDFKGSAALAFYRSAIEASAEEPPKPIATTILRNDATLIVFSPDVDHRKYAAYSISDIDFPFGSFRLVNFSRTTVRAEFSGKPELLKPGTAKTVTFRGERNNIPVRILALAEGVPPRLARQSSWSIVSSQRELIFLLPNPESGFFQMRHFLDTRQEAQP
jgi:hypothetical protein